MKKTTDFFLSLVSGLFNSLFGAGGGILTVAYMKRKDLSQKSAQATALCATYVMSAVSCIYYFFNGYLDINKAVIYLPFGIIGSIIGSILLSKIPDKILRKLFAVFIIWAGARMILK